MTGRLVVQGPAQRPAERGGHNEPKFTPGLMQGQSRRRMHEPHSMPLDPHRHDARGHRAPGREPDLHVLGALALELAPADGPGPTALAQHDAGVLAALLAGDLATFCPQAASLELVTVGAHYDAVELLRPEWPLHRELDQLAARAPQAGASSGRIIAFGAHDGQLPGTLLPAPDYLGGPLRLVPFVLGGDAATIAIVGDAFERDLLERGMAGAATALAAQDLFGLRIEHARYLTLHDLTAMMAMQYEHAGIAPLWPLIEAALLAPDSEEWLDAPPEPLVHYIGREARIALLPPAAWRARYAAHSHEDSERLERRFEQFQARQRQFAAVLGAHGVPVTFAHCARGEAAEL
jgi:hypothetical protein